MKKTEALKKALRIGKIRLSESEELLVEGIIICAILVVSGSCVMNFHFWLGIFMILSAYFILFWFIRAAKIMAEEGED